LGDTLENLIESTIELTKIDFDWLRSIKADHESLISEFEVLLM